MALDFPSSPTNGQIYGNYYYDASIGAWNSFSSIGNVIPSTLKNLTVTTDDIGVAPFTVKNSGGTTVASIDNSGTLSANSLTLTNDLTVANGGTGASTFTSGAYLKGNGTSAIQAQTGVPFADVNMIFIGAAADLNTYTTQGLYHQNANVNAAGGTNYPAPYAGLLEVFTSGTDFVYQRYTVYQAYFAVWTRAKYTTTWTSWQQVPTGTVTVAEGGTGATTLTSGAYLKGAGTSAITAQTGIPGGDITSGTVGLAYGGTGSTNGTGLVPVIPASVTPEQGTATINANGTITLTNVITLHINTCFTTTYDNYRLIWHGVVNGATGFAMRLRSGTTTEAGAIYGWSALWYGTAGSNSSIVNSATQWGAVFGHHQQEWSGDILGPYTTKATGLSGTGFGWNTSTNSTESHIDNGMIRSTAQYDGLTFYNTSGSTMSGTITIYGYRK